MKKGMKVYTETGGVATVFYSVRRQGDKLIVDSKVLDAIRMGMVFTPGEIFNGVKMALCWAVISFILLLPYFGVKRLLPKV